MLLAARASVSTSRLMLPLQVAAPRPQGAASAWRGVPCLQMHRAARCTAMSSLVCELILCAERPSAAMARSSGGESRKRMCETLSSTKASREAAASVPPVGGAVESVGQECSSKEHSTFVGASRGRVCHCSLSVEVEVEEALSSDACWSRTVESSGHWVVSSGQ